MPGKPNQRDALREKKKGKKVEEKNIGLTS